MNTISTEFSLPALIRFSLPAIFMLILTSIYTSVDGVLFPDLLGMMRCRQSILYFLWTISCAVLQLCLELAAARS